jgi:simple sugar transport system ATP-binding protein
MVVTGAVPAPEQSQASERDDAVRMVGIVKRFPGVLANDQVDLDVRCGEIHALLGENGAGKSTLMSILSGLYYPDAGQILIHGRPAAIHSPRDAIRLGIGMVHQHFMLVPVMTVAENVVLGLRQPRFFLDLSRTEHQLDELATRYGLRVDPRAHIWQLSVGEQQRVEILKMLYRGAEILILDEPTAVLTPQEVDDLFATLRRMAGEGHAIIIISHKLDEVKAIADRVTVLRKGRKVATVQQTQVSKAELARMMVGREVLFDLQKEDLSAGEVILEASDVHALGDKGLPALRGVSLSVRAGEILGIAGVAGNGQRELAEVLTGLRPCKAGCIRVCGADTTNCSPRQTIARGVGHIPEDRLGTGLVPNLSVADNLILKAYRTDELMRGPFLDPQSIRAFARDLVTRFEVSTPSLEIAVKTLSGGNLQRVLLAREISCRPAVLVAVHPTRGLDIGATEAVHRLLLELRHQGTGILLISEDLDELLALSDRLLVLYEGQVMGEVLPQEASVEEIGLMMAGTRQEDVRSRGEEAAGNRQAARSKAS